jgi:hypothetical protein
MPECVGCGYCCIRGTCAMGVLYYDISPSEVCPALYFKDGRYWCRLYKYEVWKEEFGIGCNSSMFNTWRDEVKRRTCFYCGQPSDKLVKSEEGELACRVCDIQLAKLYSDNW